MSFRGNDKGVTKVEYVIIALLISILLSGIGILYVTGLAGIPGKVEELSTATAELAAAEAEIAAALADLAESVAATGVDVTALIEDIAAIEERIAAVEEALLKERVLVIGTTVPTECLEPSGKGQWWAMMTGILVGENLFEFKPPEASEIGPLLAESYEYSADGKTVTIKLREGVKFHDGTPFNASSVKYCWERCLMLEAPVAYYLLNIDEINVLDTYTLQVKFKSPDFTWHNNLAIYYGTIIYSPTACEKAGDQWAKTVWVGTGPFKFVSFTKGEQLVLERNDDYWGSNPRLDKIVVRWFGDSATLRLALEKGEIDMAYRDLSPADAVDLEKNPDIVVEKTAGGAYILGLMFNMKSEPLDNVLVRKAIAYAIDYDYLVDVAMMGMCQRWYSVLPSYSIPYYVPVMNDINRDVEKAKALLAEAGYPDGFETTITFCPKYHGPLDRAVVTALQDQLQDVGIKLNIKEVDVAELHKISMQTGEFDITYEGWFPDFPDPDNTAFPLLASKEIGGLFASGYENPRVDELLIEGRSTLDPDKRLEIYHEIQQICYDELPRIPILESYRIIAYRAYVKDWKIYPAVCTETRSFASCYLEK